ncbi:MAG: hypothetical protein K0R15_1072 [Clostridiales bacterium]|jgi:hypothetical protein|nr:hypothetical protein [Clostridiales bacterium]
MKVIIDRIEEEFVVVELSNGTFVNLPKVLLPGAKEGDVITIKIDMEETLLRKERIEKLMNPLWEE